MYNAHSIRSLPYSKLVELTLLLTFGRRFHRKAGAIPEESLSSARCRCLFGQMPVSVLGEARLSGARSNRLEGLESHRVGDTGRQGYKKRGSFAGFLFYGILI